MRKIKNKKVWFTAFLATAFTLFGTGIAMVDSVDASAENVVTAESVELVMDKGAGVRLGTADGNNGIRFVLTMDKTEYSSLMEKVGTGEEDLYSEISFGMIITKASYVTDAKDLTVDNVFGSEAVFEWKPEGADENWTVSEGKSLVVNQTFGYLGTAEDYDSDYVGFASIVELQDYNLTQEFVGRGYMKYTTVDGSVNYRMADYYEGMRTNNVRSMTYVAQKAVEDPEMSGYVDTLNSLYITHLAVQAKTVNVTVNHHKVDLHGNETVETETLTGQTIGATATATALTDEAWVYDETKSTASGVVYANDKTVLDLYYNQNPETVYDLWFVGGVDPQDKTDELNTPVIGGVYGDTVRVTLKLDLLEGTMPGIKFYVKGSTNGTTQLTQVQGSFLDVAEYANGDGTYTFTTDFAWKNGNWDINSVTVFVPSGSYKLGVDVVAVDIIPVEYDFKINKATSAIHTLDEAVTGALIGDTAEVTLEFIELYSDLTKVRIALLNASGAAIANNGDAYYTLADCATEDENTYKFTIAFPWNNKDWDVTAIRVGVDSENYVVGVNVKSIEVKAQASYDLVINNQGTVTHTLDNAVTGAVRYDSAKITLELVELYSDLTKVHITLLNANGDAIANNGNAYFTLADCATGEENTYQFTMNFPWASGDWDVAAIRLTVDAASYVVGVNVKSVEIIPVEYDFELSNASTVMYTLTEAVTGAVRYDSAVVELELAEIVGDLTKVKIYLLNANGDTIANNSDAYYTLADCATEETNTYQFTMNFPWAYADTDVAKIQLTVDSENYVVGVNVKSIEIVPVEYDLKWLTSYSAQTYTLETPLTGAVLNDTIIIEATFTTMYGNLNANNTDIYVQLFNPAGTGLNNTWIELSDWLVEDTTNQYRIELTLTWDVADLTIGSIVMQSRASTKCGVNIGNVSIKEVEAVEYDVEITGSYTPQIYNLDTPVTGAVKNDTLVIVATIDTLSGDLNHSTNTDLYFELFGSVDATGTNVMNKWVEISSFLVEGTTNQYRFEIALTWGLTDFTVSSIRMQLRANASCGIKIESVTIQSAA